MASGSSQTAHSTSTSAALHTYDVFLSFRGEDTRHGFTDHLYDALNQKGIIVFRDNEELKRGVNISENLLKVIKESEYAVVIISKNYVFSKWCLIELTEIMKCRRNNHLTVLPIFYHVTPSEVRNQKETFANAFAMHREAPEVDKEQWCNALKEVGQIAGWFVHDRYESTIVKEICGMIFGGLNRRVPNNFKDIVGIESQVKEMMTLLHIGAEDVRFIGIYGMGGIGKTILANIIFERISSEFDASCIVDDVRKEVEKLGILGLQKQLISQIFNDRNFEIWNASGAMRVIANRLRNRKIFVILDNVNKDEQLKALIGNHEWFGQGSRILVTSRDKQLLERYVDKTYEVNGLSNDNALRLFSLKAFKEYHPKSDYVNLSKNIVDYARGLPLALEVLGSLLYGKGVNAWEIALDRFKAEPNAEIVDKLEISFEDLSNLQKELFLDIACFYDSEEKVEFIRKLKSLGHYPEFDFEVLIDKSLIKDFHMTFYMHDLIREMGQQIVRRQSLKDPGKRSRLWCHEDIINVLKNNTGTDAVEAILLKLPLPKSLKLSFEGFSKMKKLKMLVIHPSIVNHHIANDDEILKDLSTLEWYGDPSNFMLSNDLRVIEWWGYPLEYLPTNFELDNLVEFRMPMNSIKQLWDPRKILDKLKYIDLSDSHNLIEMPDLSGVPNLEELDVRGTIIRQLSSSLVLQKNLSALCVGGSFLRPVTFQLPDLSLFLKSLKVLELVYCNLWDGALPSDLSRLSLLEKLDLSGNNFTRIDGLSQLSKLVYLELNDCTRLEELAPGFSLSLFVVGLRNCPSLNTFSNPKDIWSSSEALVAGGASVVASYFGYNFRFDRTLHLAKPYRGSKIEATALNLAHTGRKSKSAASRTELTFNSLSWGPTLSSDIPEWFTERSVSPSGISGMFGCQMDFNMFDGRSTNNDGIGLFIVYQISELNSSQRKRKRETQKVDEGENSSSEIFPVFDLELQVNKDVKVRGANGELEIPTVRNVPLAIRVPEVPSSGRNGVWVFISSGCFSGRYVVWRCSISISSPNVLVKECGGRVVRDHSSRRYEIIRSISAHDFASDYRRHDFYGSCLFVNGPIKRARARRWEEEEGAKAEEEEEEEYGLKPTATHIFLM